VFTPSLLNTGGDRESRCAGRGHPESFRARRSPYPPRRMSHRGRTDHFGSGQGPRFLTSPYHRTIFLLVTVASPRARHWSGARPIVYVAPTVLHHLEFPSTPNGASLQGRRLKRHRRRECCWPCDKDPVSLKILGSALTCAGRAPDRIGNVSMSPGAALFAPSRSLVPWVHSAARRVQPFCTCFMVCFLWPLLSLLDRTTTVGSTLHAGMSRQ